MRSAAFILMLCVLGIVSLTSSHALVLSKTEKWIVCTEYSMRSGGVKCSEPRKVKVWTDDLYPGGYRPEEVCPRNAGLLDYIIKDISMIFGLGRPDVSHFRLFKSLEEAQSWCNKNCIRER